MIENDKKKYIGFCIDTCHIFSEGLYDLRRKEQILKMYEDFNQVIGLDKLTLIHLNDSKTEFSSKADKHARIGEGEIWGDINVFKYFLSKMKEYGISSVLETVEDDYKVVQNVF